MYHEPTDTWAAVHSGQGIACVCMASFKVPEVCATTRDLGMVHCNLRTKGGIGNFNVQGVMLPLASLVFACDWVITENSEQSIRGCPVPIGCGSPLGVAFRGPSGAMILAGSSIEIACPKPELYMRGRNKISALVIGFYCTKRQKSMDGGVYHVIASEV